MGQRGKRKHLRATLKRYSLGDKKKKKCMLDEFSKICSYNRKYAIRLLSRGEIQAVHRTSNPTGHRVAYDYPKALFERLIESPLISTATKNQLQSLFSKQDPFKLQRQIQRKIKAILDQTDPLPTITSTHEQIA